MIFLQQGSFEMKSSVEVDYIKQFRGKVLSHQPSHTHLPKRAKDTHVQVGLDELN